MRTSRCAALAATCGLLAVLGCGGLTPASLVYVDTIPAQPRIGDITTVRFRAIDNTGQPLAGAVVEFSIPDASNSGGVTLSPESATSNRGDGIASTQIVAAGARPASVVVQARAGSLVAVSPSISFSGATAPNGRQFTFQCGTVAGAASGGVHAIGAFDVTRHLIAGVKLRCFAHVGDRNGTGIPGALVSFMTEAGTIGASGISLSDVIGNAEILHKTSYPLPKDVAPGTFTFNTSTASDNTGALLAPLWMHPYDWSTNPIQDLLLGRVPDGREPRRIDPHHRQPHLQPARQPGGDDRRHLRRGGLHRRQTATAPGTRANRSTTSPSRSSTTTTTAPGTPTSAGSTPTGTPAGTARTTPGTATR